MRGGGRRRPDLALLACIASALFFVFLLGGVFGARGWQPYRFFANAVRSALALNHERGQVRPDLLEPIRYRGEGVTIRRDGASPGLTAVQGLFGEGVEVRLIDLSGRVVHRWRADFDAIWPDPAHVYPRDEVPDDELHYQTHGMVLLPDGSAVINFDGLGTAKLDKCGAVQWTVNRATHHVVTPNPDGSFWIPSRTDVRRLDERVLLQDAAERDLSKAGGRYEDTLLLVGPDGAIRAEISVMQALLDGRFATELYDVRAMSPTDPTHLNDIEVVTPALAARIAGVEPGDLLVSLRQMHMLAIIGRRSGAVEWSQVGPWVRQHDAVITPDGMLDVLNNGDSRLAVLGEVGSTIIRLDPATGVASTAYPLAGQAHFFTRIMGAQELLPNGNRLIAESMAGRVMEVDAAGNLVWEYVKAYDKTHAALLQSAHRYAPGYFSVADWDCPAR
jgi:hypothetical protein